MLTVAERLWDTALILPEPLLAEVLDFAEFLQTRKANIPGKATDVSPYGIMRWLRKFRGF